MLFDPERSRFGGEVASSLSRPPDHLYLPKGGITCAWRAAEVPFAGKRSRHSGAQKAGLAYQKRIGKWILGNLCNFDLIPSPWFAYCDSSNKRRYCQPDFILLDEPNKTIIIVEVKITWTSSAWFQLRCLYEPVLRTVYEGWTVIPLVISRSYDPALPKQEEPRFCNDLTNAAPNQFNVLIVR